MADLQNPCKEDIPKYKLKYQQLHNKTAKGVRTLSTQHFRDTLNQPNYLRKTGLVLMAERTERSCSCTIDITPFYSHFNVDNYSSTALVQQSTIIISESFAIVLSTYHEKCDGISIRYHADLLQSAPALEAVVKNPADAQIN